MKRILSAVLTVIEGAVFLATAALLVATRADSLVQNTPLSLVALIAAEIITLALAVVSVGFFPSVRTNWKTVAGVTLVAALAVHVALPSVGSVFTASPVRHFYYGVVILFGALGSAPGWIGALALVIFCELGSQIVACGAAVLSTIPAMLPSFGYLAAAGALSYFAARCLAAAAPVTRPAASQPSGLATPAPSGRGETQIRHLTDSDSKILVTTAEFAMEGLAPQQKAATVDEILSSVVYFMQRNFEAFSSLGFIYDPGRGMFKLNSHQSKSVQIMTGAEIPLGKGVVGRIGVEKRSFLSGDLSMYGGETLYYRGPEIINSILAVPIISEDKELLGALVVDSKANRTFTEHHKEIMRRFSSLAAALITNARMRMQLQETAAQFQTFYETSQRFTTALSVEAVFDVLFDTTMSLAQPSRIMAFTFDTRRQVGIVYKVRSGPGDIPEGLEFPINDGIYSYSYKNKTVVSIPDYAQRAAEYFRFAPNEPRTNLPRSLVVLPILDDEMRCLGLLSVESDQPGRFEGKLAQLLSTLAGNASVAVTRAMLYQRMERLATTDGLTGLNNHRNFQEQLTKEIERAKRYNRTFSLLLMDIDHFKSFNDTYGHPVGDLVLKEISGCIRRSIRQSDFPARYGGEEFTVILAENDERGALVTAERIRQTVESHVIRAEGKDLRVTISVGCAVFPDHATEKAQLIDCADKSLYYSKENGRNRVTMYRKGI